MAKCLPRYARRPSLNECLAAESGQTFHIAIGQIIEAYVMVTLVDFFGDVPYSESLKAADLDLDTRLNPQAQPGAEIYAAMHTKLDEAITALGSNPGAPANDFFYGGNASKWIKAANTLKMKMYITVKDYASFQSIVVVVTTFHPMLMTFNSNGVITKFNLTHVTLGMLLVIPLQVVDVICRTG